MKRKRSLNKMRRKKKHKKEDAIEVKLSEAITGRMYGPSASFIIIDDMSSKGANRATVDLQSHVADGDWCGHDCKGAGRANILGLKEIKADVKSIPADTVKKICHIREPEEVASKIRIKLFSNASKIKGFVRACRCHSFRHLACTLLNFLRRKR